jgi:hypothetical protein
MQIHDKAGNFILDATLDQGLYKVSCFPQLAKAQACAVTENSNTYLMHRCFGHIGMSTLGKMSRSGAVLNLPPAKVFDDALSGTSTAVCAPCAGSRQKAQLFPRSTIKERIPYAKLHVDIAERRT